MASMSDVLKNKNVKKISISDTSANLQAGMGGLISNNSKIIALDRTDAKVMTLTSSNYTLANSSGGVLSKIAAGAVTGNTLTGQINVTGVSTADAATKEADAKVNTFTLSDTLSNVVDASATGGALNTLPSKVTSIQVSAKALKSMTTTDYDAFKAKTALIAKIATIDNPNALKGAFAVTGASVADSKNVGTYGADAMVKTIAVNDSTGAIPTATKLASSTMSSKIVKVDLTMTAAQLATGGIANIAALGSKLNALTISDAASLTVSASDIRSKDAINAMAKTKGSTNSPIGLNVIDASLADVKGLLINKQVNDAKIVDTAKNLLRFSADAFAAIPKTSHVEITIADSATNIDKYHAELASAVATYQQNYKLSVTDTKVNIANNLHSLEIVADAITGPMKDLTKIAIKQVTALGAADTGGTVEVASLTQYTTDHNVLDYVAHTTNMAAQHVDIKAGDDESGVYVAKTVSQTIQMKKYVDDVIGGAGTPLTHPTYKGGAASAPEGDLTKYADVKNINISLKNLTAIADYQLVAADTDIVAMGTFAHPVGVNISISA